MRELDFASRASQVAESRNLVSAFKLCTSHAPFFNVWSPEMLCAWLPMKPRLREAWESAWNDAGVEGGGGGPHLHVNRSLQYFFLCSIMSVKLLKRSLQLPHIRMSGRSAEKTLLVNC